MSLNNLQPELQLINNALEVSSLYDPNILTIINSYIFSKKITYYGNGNVKSITNYKYEKKEGYQSWHKNGNKWVKFIIKEDKLDGLYQEWHENGNKYKKCTYKDGEIDGLYEEWYNNGKKFSETIYKDGNLV